MTATTSAAKLDSLARLGADGVVMDGTDHLLAAAEVTGVSHLSPRALPTGTESAGELRYPSWRQGFKEGVA